MANPVTPDGLDYFEEPCECCSEYIPLRKERIDRRGRVWCPECHDNCDEGWQCQRAGRAAGVLPPKCEVETCGLGYEDHDNKAEWDAHEWWAQVIASNNFMDKCPVCNSAVIGGHDKWMILECHENRQVVSELEQFEADLRAGRI